MGSTRHGDWAMRMRFWGVNTREMEKSARQRLSARASHPKARSHNPITAPERFTLRCFAPSRTPDSAPYRTSAALGLPLSSPAATSPNQSGDALCDRIKEETAQRAGDT